MSDEYEKYNKMAEWIAAHSDSVTPEYTGQMLNEATSTIDSWLSGDARIHELAKRGYARSWLEEEAEKCGYQSVTVTPKYPDNIMRKVRQKLDLEEYDTSRDAEINDMSHDTVFRSCLEWEGIIGFEYEIKNWVQNIYDVTLS